MDWRDQGALLSVRKHAGVVRGGTSRKIAPILQPGAQLDLAWRARLEEHIGSYSVEPLKSRATILSDRTALAGLNAMTSLLCFALPEREVHPQLYHHTQSMLDLLGTNPAWPTAYLKWELALLDALGFGLELTSCAVTGSFEGLVYVSPNSGRAVSQKGAGEWADRLLPLPPDLLGRGDGSRANVVKGLMTTGHFLTHRLAPSLGQRPLPAMRARLLDRLHKEALDEQ